jgi:hypothetical protein
MNIQSRFSYVEVSAVVRRAEAFFLPIFLVVRPPVVPAPFPIVVNLMDVWVAR